MGGVDHGCRLYCFAMRSNKKEKNLQFRIDSGGKVRYIWWLKKKKKKKCTSEREEPLFSGSSQLSLKIDQTSWQKMKRHIPPFFFFLQFLFLMSTLCDYERHVYTNDFISSFLFYWLWILYYGVFSDVVFFNIMCRWNFVYSASFYSGKQKRLCHRRILSLLH